MRKTVRFLIALMAAGILAPFLQAQPRQARGQSISEGAGYYSQRPRRNNRTRRNRRQLRRGNWRYDLRHQRRNRLRRLRRFDRRHRFRPGLRYYRRHHGYYPRSGFFFYFGRRGF